MEYWIDGKSIAALSPWPLSRGQANGSPKLRPPGRAGHANSAVPPVAIPPVSVWAAAALDFHADPLQTEVLDSPDRRVILNASRQFGKSVMAAARIAHQAIHYPGSEIIIASPGQRQSGELFYKVKSLLPRLGLRPKSDGINEHSLLFPNGSRIVGLPDAPDHVRGFSGTALLIIDEAAYASAELYVAVMPFLATSNGTMWVISTPRGQSGLFYDLWHNEKLSHWRRFRLTADQCPRISAEFLAEMKLIHPARYWEEFMCEFRAATTQVFDRETLDRCQDDAYEPFFGNGV